MIGKEEKPLYCEYVHFQDMPVKMLKTLFSKGYSFIKQTFASGPDTHDGLHLLSVARGDRKGIHDLISERWVEGRKKGREDISGTGDSMCKGPV